MLEVDDEMEMVQYARNGAHPGCRIMVPHLICMLHACFVM